MKPLLVIAFLMVSNLSYAQAIIDTKKIDYFGWHIREDDTVFITPANVKEAGFASISKGKSNLEIKDTEPFYIVDKIRRATYDDGTKDILLLLKGKQTKGYTMRLNIAIEADEVLAPAGFSRDSFVLRDAYVASNGDVYLKGDVLFMGQGTGNNGNFKFVKKSAKYMSLNDFAMAGYGSVGSLGVSGNGAVAIGGIPVKGNRLSGRNAGDGFAIMKIEKRGNGKKGYTHYALINKRGEIYEVELAEALQSGEVN